MTDVAGATGATDATGAADARTRYARTIVEIRRPDEGDVVVRPAPTEEVGGWPWPSAEPVYLLTAWDPGEERPGLEVNRRRQAALEAELRPLVGAMWVALGTDPVTGRQEEGVAVRGVRQADVLAVAARYRQDAIFVWTPREWATVSCRDGRREASGWVLSRQETPGGTTPRP
ncbi:MAG TPA: DUF3293 domain-containing protein [Acidimicrobiales bacterium]|nr:DUF3293 domain-containing protein [Acidimicrobiales bacterium]